MHEHEAKANLYFSFPCFQVIILSSIVVGRIWHKFYAVIML